MAINRNGTVTASTDRACVGSLAAHLDKFAEFLAGEGYVSQTIKDKCALVTALSRWLKQRRVPLTKLNEARLKQFHAHRSGSRRRGDVYTGYFCAVSAWFLHYHKKQTRRRWHSSSATMRAS
jgi:hypothetical protein